MVTTLTIDLAAGRSVGILATVVRLRIPLGCALPIRGYLGRGRGLLSHLSGVVLDGTGDGRHGIHVILEGLFRHIDAPTLDVLAQLQPVDEHPGCCLLECEALFEGILHGCRGRASTLFDCALALFGRSIRLSVATVPVPSCSLLTVFIPTPPRCISWIRHLVSSVSSESASLSYCVSVSSVSSVSDSVSDGSLSDCSALRG